MKINKKASQGFTMVELIVVIVLIGILAAVAIPRFINQTSNARIAALNGLQGAIASAVALTQAQYQATGTLSATTVTMADGTIVTVAATTGIPVAAAGGINSAMQLTGFAFTGGSTTATFNLPTSVANCNLTYTAGASTLTTSGC